MEEEVQMEQDDMPWDDVDEPTSGAIAAVNERVVMPQQITTPITNVANVTKIDLSSKEKESLANGSTAK